MKMILRLIVVVACMVPQISSAQGSVPANWFRRTGQPVYVKSPECNYKASSKIHCIAVVENEDPEGIASIGMKWEQLGADSKVLGNIWTSADFQFKHPSSRPNREFEGRGNVVFEEEMDARDGLERVHLHFVFVERKNGSVIPAEEAESIRFKRLLKARAEAEAKN